MLSKINGPAVLTAQRQARQAAGSSFGRMLAPWLLGGVLTLAGCVELDGLGTGSRSSAPVVLMAGAITVMPPAGYCVDTKASHATQDSAVLLMGKCSGSSQVAPALITVSIGAEGSAGVLRNGATALSDYFRSATGRAALARNGKAASVGISRVSVASGALVMRVEDASVGAYWRAVLGQGGRLVTLSVSAPEGGSLSAEAGRAILERAIAALRRANPAAAVPKGSALVAAAPAAAKP